MQIWNAATQEGSSGPASRLHSALMAVLTHMVGRLGSLAIQDPHIQSVLYALLQKGLEGSPAEQEVLVEDALKLLNATLSASSTLAEPLQVCWLPPLQPDGRPDPESFYRKHSQVCLATLLAEHTAAAKQTGDNMVQLPFFRVVLCCVT